ncbi:hypothetical protein FRC17_010309 [Serendipita sp. 399]|nr:hypothetical protein FRC17_010309 [Serendipita sp. 399]
MSSWREIAVHLLTIRPRLRSILISGLHATRIVPDSFISVFRDLSPLPNIYEIGSTVETTFAPPRLLYPILLQSDSPLRHVFNIPLSEEALSLPGARGLVQVMTNDHSPSLLQALARQCPHLQIVAFTRLAHVENPRHHRTSSPSSDQWHGIVQGHKGLAISWDTLHFSRRPSSLGLFLVSLGARTLSDISITINAGQIPTLLDILSTAERLALLRLELVPSSKYNRIQLPSTPVPLTLRKLHLSFLTACSPEEQDAERTFFDVLATKLVECMLFITQLRIYDKRRHYTAPFLGILAEMSMVEDVEVHTWAKIATTTSEVDTTTTTTVHSLPQWKRVKVVGPESVATLFRFHRLTELTVRCSYSSKERDLQVVPLMLPNDRPFASDRKGDIIPFQYLRDLRLLGPSFQMTRWCLHLASSPYTLPSLESISMYSYPSWDSLFLLLERRNLSSFPSPIIRRLKRIELPEFTSPLIVDLLRELLRGRALPWRPSNLELSSDMVETKLRDPNLCVAFPIPLRT